MWSDTLFSAERLHLLRIAIWGAACVVAGAASLIVARRLDARPSLARGFGWAIATIGLAELCFGAAGYRSVSTRNLESAAQLEDSLRLAAALLTAAIAAGATISATAWVAGRRWTFVGGGIATVTSAAALLLLDLQFLGMVRR